MTRPPGQPQSLNYTNCEYATFCSEQKGCLWLFPLKSTVAIQELLYENWHLSREVGMAVNLTGKRQAEFQELFDLPTFGLPTDYFDMNGLDHLVLIAVVNINLTFSQKNGKHQLREQNTSLHSQLMHGKSSLMKKRLNIHCQIVKHASTTTAKSKQPIHPSQYSSHSLLQ